MARRTAGLLLALAIATSVAAPPAQADPFEIEQVLPCLMVGYPSAVAVTPTQERITVRVAVVLHNVGVAQARKVVARAQDAYTPLGIELQPTFLSGYLPEQTHEELFPKLKRLFGGQRPAWAHAVMLLTAGTLGSSDDYTPAAGFADCAGGVAYPDRSFALVSADGGTTSTAEAFGHELGHLLGARHENHDCVQGSREAGYPDACTLMFPDVVFTSLTFGAVAGSIVRGHAEAYVKPLAATPPPDGTVLNASPFAGLDPCSVAAYRDPAGDQSDVPGLRAGEADVTGGQFFLRDGRPWIRVGAVEIDGEIDQASQVSWRVTVVAETTRYQLQAAWDGAGAPTTTLTDVGTGKSLPVAGTVVVPGTPGIVEIPWPLPTDATLTLGKLEGSVGPLRKEAPYGYNTDAASPLLGGIQLSNCGRAAANGNGTATATRSPAPKVRPSAPGTEVARSVTGAGRDNAATVTPAVALRAAKALRFTLVDRSARRASRDRRLAVRVRGAARDVFLRLVDRRGRTAGRGALSRVEGTATAYVQLPRGIKPGRYVLVASTRGGVAQRIAVRLR